MKRIEKTVFISYRRTNLPWALAIFQNLKSEGYDVFFDYLSIPSGDFESIIVENIRARAHFVVILTPSALERCNEPGDWLRREIETAMDEKRNIVPLMLESFDFGSPSTVKALTGKLENLRKYNGLRVPSEFFFEAMIRLREQYLNVSPDAVVHPVSETARPITADHQVAASEAAPVEREELTAQEWFEKGYVFAENKNFSEAIRCYAEAIRLQPDFAAAYNNRGLARKEDHDLQGALADYDVAIRLRPDYATAYYNRGLARREHHDLRGALADYDEAIRLQPNFAAAYNNRGLARKAAHDLRGALADYDSALRLQPDFVEAYNNRGLARSANKDLQGALADFDEAIRLRPNYADAYDSRGTIHQASENLEAAVRDYEEVLRLRPDDGMVRSSLTSVLRKLGRNADADQQEKMARELVIKENEYNQACFEAICGNVERALELLRIALEKKQSTQEWARSDPDFESIREDARFKEIVGL